MNYTFRSAAFGGFNRQDVLDFLEASSKEALQRQSELQSQLDAARESLAGREAELESLRGQLAELLREKESLEARLAQLEREHREESARAQAELDTARAAAAQREQELSALRQEAEDLRAKVAWMEPDAAAYAVIKVRTAGIELEAHRRAQTIEDQAREAAETLRRQTEEELAAQRAQAGEELAALRARTEEELQELRRQTEAEAGAARLRLAQWLDQTEEAYGALCAGMGEAIAQAGVQLEQARGGLAAADALLEEQKTALAAALRPGEAAE